jgi:hypothetical protein
MQDIRIDQQGRQRCWNCGGLNFTQQRTARSKVGFGISSALTKPKLRCVRCSEYNDVGSARPYTGPASPSFKAEWDAEGSDSSTEAGHHQVAVVTPIVPAPPPPAPVVLQTGTLGDPKERWRAAVARASEASNRVTAAAEEIRPFQETWSTAAKTYSAASEQAVALIRAGKKREGRAMVAGEVEYLRGFMEGTKEVYESKVLELHYDDLADELRLAVAEMEECQSAMEAEERVVAAATKAAVAMKTSVADELRKLADLKEAGLLSEDEFAAQKAKLLA